MGAFLENMQQIRPSLFMYYCGRRGTVRKPKATQKLQPDLLIESHSHRVKYRPGNRRLFFVAISKTVSIFPPVD